MSAFTNAISTMEGFLGFTGEDPTTEEEYNAALAATDNNMEAKQLGFLVPRQHGQKFRLRLQNRQTLQLVFLKLLENKSF